VARGAGLEGARLAVFGEGVPTGALAGAWSAARSDFTSGDCPADNYFIHVGAFADHKQALAWLATLDIDEIKVCLVVHARDDYYFYGLMIPAGDDFPSAKARERHLADQWCPRPAGNRFCPSGPRRLIKNRGKELMVLKAKSCSPDIFFRSFTLFFALLLAWVWLGQAAPAPRRRPRAQGDGGRSRG
jgi:hypothetical protein